LPDSASQRSGCVAHKTKRNKRQPTPTLTRDDRIMLDAIRTILGHEPFYIEPEALDERRWTAWPSSDAVRAWWLLVRHRRDL